MYHILLLFQLREQVKKTLNWFNPLQCVAPKTALIRTCFMACATQSTLSLPGLSSSWTKELKDTNPLMSSLLVICLGWCSNFVGSESGQKLLQNMVYSTVQHPPPLQSHTQSVPYILYTAVHLV